MRREILIFSILTILAFCNFSEASDITPYLGIDLGTNHLKSTNTEEKAGISFQSKLLGSWDFNQDFLIEPTIGFRYLELESSEVKIVTKSIFSELSLKYKITKNLSFGPSVGIIGGTDNSNSESVGKTSVNSFLNLKLNYQTKLNDNLVRFEMGLESSNKNLTSILVGFQFGFPFEKQKTINENPINLKMAKLTYGTDVYEINSSDLSKIKKLANFLKENNNEWQRVKISGHTDITGGPSYNKALSQDRADTILKILVKEGVNELKLSSFGFGNSRPVDKDSTNSAFSKNRRTEIEFFGVSDRNWFNSKLNEILK